MLKPNQTKHTDLRGAAGCKGLIFGHSLTVLQLIPQISSGIQIHTPPAFGTSFKCWIPKTPKLGAAEWHWEARHNSFVPQLLHLHSQHVAHALCALRAWEEFNYMVRAECGGVPGPDDLSSRPFQEKTEGWSWKKWGWRRGVWMRWGVEGAWISPQKPWLDFPPAAAATVQSGSLSGLNHSNVWNVCRGLHSAALSLCNTWNAGVWFKGRIFVLSCMPCLESKHFSLLTMISQGSLRAAVLVHVL